QSTAVVRFSGAPHRGAFSLPAVPPVRGGPPWCSRPVGMAPDDSVLATVGDAAASPEAARVRVPGKADVSRIVVRRRNRFAQQFELLVKRPLPVFGGDAAEVVQGGCQPPGYLRGAG